MAIKQHPLYRKWTHIRSCLVSERYRQQNRIHENMLECDWTRFKDFVEDIEYFLGYPTEPNMVLSRRDTTRGWTLKNLHWAEKKSVGQRQRTAIRFKYKGQTKCLSEWCREFNVSIWTARRRYHKGMKFRQIFA